MHAQLVSNLIRSIITDNFEFISAAPESNIFKQYFKIFQIDFNKDGIADLPESCLKELAVIIDALVDYLKPAALSLYWLICYIEENLDVKQKVDC